MKLPRLLLATAVLATALALPAEAAPAQRNIVIFVADGLRYVSVTPQSAPDFWAVKSKGVDFINSHSLYPTITTVNASAIATGHYIGDTGNFGNALYSGFDSSVTKAPIAAMENDITLGEMNDHFGGNYLNETSLIAAARQAGYATAVMGKIGPTSIQDVTQRDGAGTIVIDDALGTPKGLPVPADIAAAMKANGIADTAPKTDVPNDVQQKYMIDIATKAVLPHLAASGHPFILFYWSRDPDNSQHGTKDSIGKLTPGINGPTGLAGIKDANDSFATLMAALKERGLDKTTDVFVTADHGFSTIDHHSATSTTAKTTGETVSGFLAYDLADALNLPLTDPGTHKPVDYKNGEKLSGGSGFLMGDGGRADVLIVANGGSDHIYLPNDDAKDRAKQIVEALSREDYVSGIFVNDDLGKIPGALPMSAVNLMGSALTPKPSIVVSFASHPIAGCKPLLMCAAENADTPLETGQGMHGTFSRADTRNFMAAIGPDFKARFADPSPVSNADITPTLAHILALDIAPKGTLRGRAATEALRGGKPIAAAKHVVASEPAANGEKTVLDYQTVGATRYFDAAGFPGRTVGLSSHQLAAH
jgi:arylsulfatase A-like enzyme